jgi:ubiquitin C-terminal hydrolase
MLITILLQFIKACDGVRLFVQTCSIDSATFYKDFIDEIHNILETENASFKIKSITYNGDKFPSIDIDVPKVGFSFKDGQMLKVLCEVSLNQLF